MQKGDRLVLYTDGVVSAKNEEGEAYGDERFQESVRKQGGMNSAAFVNFGEVSSAHVIYDRTSGRSRGFGFVEMRNHDEAAAALEALGQIELQGNKLRLSEADTTESTDS